MVQSVFQNHGQICTDLKDQAAGRLKDRGFAWGHVAVGGWTFGVDFPGFCRSEVDGSSGGIGFVKFFLDLRGLE